MKRAQMFFILGILSIILTGFVFAQTGSVNSGVFCGTSTRGYCSTSNECKIGGCSGQVCENKNQSTVTTCEYAECYNRVKYNMTCGCVSNACIWYQNITSSQCGIDSDCGKIKSELKCSFIDNEVVNITYTPFCSNGKCMERSSTRTFEICGTNKICSNAKCISNQTSIINGTNSNNNATQCVQKDRMCGGIQGLICCSGLRCNYYGNYPDASGICVSISNPNENHTIVNSTNRENNENDDHENQTTINNTDDDNEIECSDHRYSNCPTNCLRRCISSGSSGNVSNGSIVTADCEGIGSCYSKKEIKNEWKNMTSEERKDFIKEVKDERNDLRMKNGICPLNCTCTGSVIKCYLGDGTSVMTIYAGRSGNIIIQISGENMTTNVTLYHHDGKIFGIFRNETDNEENITKEIAITPDQVKERIRERLRTRACDNSSGCNITLNEDGYYKVQVLKKARLFAIFSVKEIVKVKIDPETGNVTIHKPWWRFLARELNEN